MYALLVLDMQVGLVHGPDRPWRGPELLETVNALLHKARSAGAGIFLARHIGPVGSPIEPGSPLTLLAPELTLLGSEAQAQCLCHDRAGRAVACLRRYRCGDCRDENPVLHRQYLPGGSRPGL